MKTMKRVTAATMAVFMGVASMTGCGTKSSSDKVTMPETAPEIAKLASERTNALDSYAMDGTMALDIDAMGQAVKGDITFDAVYFKDPMKLKMDMTIGFESGDESDEMTAALYFMKEDDTYTYYMNMNDGEEDQWMKQTLDPEDEDQKSLIDQLEAGLTGKVETDSALYEKYAMSEEQPDDAVSLDLKITGADIMNAISESGVDTSALDSQLATAGLSTSLFEQIGELPIVTTVDKENVYLKSMSVDMTETVQTLVDTIMETMMSAYGEAADKDAYSVTVNKLDMNFNYSDYNAAEDFELPAEAADAEDMSDTASLLEDAEE